MNPGDLGRRLRERREELGLSVADVASRAGVDEGFLHYLEESTATGITSATLFSLARALGTTAPVLEGGGTQRPPRRWGPGGYSYLEVLDKDACVTLVGPGGVGRVTFLSARGPIALPVNYAILGDDVVFRTHEHTSIAGALRSGGAHAAPMGFEVDHIDYALEEGWCVLVSGEAHEVLDAAELAEVEGLVIDPWTGDGRQHYVRLPPSEMTGRRIRIPR